LFAAVKQFCIKLQTATVYTYLSIDPGIDTRVNQKIDSRLGKIDQVFLYLLGQFASSASAFA
jgi:hypothetical protein